MGLVHFKNRINEISTAREEKESKQAEIIERYSKLVDSFREEAVDLRSFDTVTREELIRLFLRDEFSINRGLYKENKKIVIMEGITVIFYLNRPRHNYADPTDHLQYRMDWEIKIT
jgi:hypothetical protein